MSRETMNIDIRVTPKEYADLKQLSDAKGEKLVDYCINVFKEHIQASKNRT